MSNSCLVRSLAVSFLTLVPSAGGIFSIALTSHAHQQSPGAGARPPAPSPVPVMPPQALTGTGGELYLPAGEPALVGVSFDVDPVNGHVVPRRPVFTCAVDENTGQPVTDIVFSSRFTQSSVLESSSYSTSVSANFWGIGVDAAAGGHHTTGGETISTAFFLGEDLTYPDARVPLAALPLSALTDEAKAILQMPDVNTRTQQWLSQGFGRYVAVGYQLRGKLGIKVSLDDSLSFSARSNWARLSAEYGSASGTINLASAVLTAMTTSGLSVTIHAEGMPATAFHLPTPDAIDDPNEQVQWTNSLLAAAGNAKARRGLILVPANNLQNGPLPDMPDWNDSLVSGAAIEVRHATELLNLSAERWSSPWTLVAFLDARSAPGSTLSYHDARVTAHIVLSERVRLVESAVQAYVAGSPGTPQEREMAVQQRRQELDVAMTQLSSVLTSIETMASSVPTLQITDAQVTWQPLGGGYWYNATGWIDVEPVGVFRDGSIEGNLATFTSGLRVYGDPTYNGGPCTVFDGGLTNVFIEPLQTIPTGSEQGLRRARVHFTARVHSSSQWMQIQLEDDLLRSTARTVVFP